MKLIISFLLAVLTGTYSTAHATDVTFRCEMSVQIDLEEFDADADILVVRGSFNNWTGNTHRLLPEGTLYSLTTEISPGDIEYKFVKVRVGGDVWEATNIRTATVGWTPLVLPIVYFSDIESSETADVEVRFLVNMSVQVMNGNFDPATDWIVVRGAHDSLFQWGGSRRLYEVAGNPGVYYRWVLFPSLPLEGQIDYKYVILENGNVNAAFWENVANRSFQPTGNEPDLLPPPSGNGYGEIMPEEVYFADVTPEDVLTNDVDVVFSVDARPLYGKIADLGYIRDIQTGDTMWAVQSIQIAGFFNNWPWANFPAEYFLNDNGNDGDEFAGDSLFSLTVEFEAGDPRIVIYKYGANELDVEANFARHHSQEINDTEPLYRMSVDCWGSPDTLFQHWPCLPRNRGSMTTLTFGPPLWVYELFHVSGEIDSVLFTNVCEGTVVTVGDEAEAAGWSAILDSSTVFMVTGTPLTNGSLGTFSLEHPACAGNVTCFVEGDFAAIPGPAGQGIPRAPENLTIFYDSFAPSLVLRWSPVAEDYAGQAIIPDFYYVFRSDESGFPGGGYMIGQVAGTDSTLFADYDVGGVGPVCFYRVVTVMYPR